VSPAESASDAFICLPNASDAASLDDAFTATGDVYLAAWNACDKLYPFDAKTGRGFSRRRLPITGHADPHDNIDADELFRDVVTPERRHLARGLGSSVDQVFMFYVRKAIGDHQHYVSPFGGGYPYQPWLHIGFPLPFDDVSIETTEDALDWLRFGTIGPVAFGFIGSIPSRAHTVCFKRTEDLDGYEVVFVGEEIDPADGQML